jgi:hypothetical protein
VSSNAESAMTTGMNSHSFAERTPEKSMKIAVAPPT